MRDLAEEYAGERLGVIAQYRVLGEALCAWPYIERNEPYETTIPFMMVTKKHNGPAHFCETIDPKAFWESEHAEFLLTLTE